MSPRTRYFAASLLVVAPFGGPSAVGPFISNGSSDVEPKVVVTFRDDRIDESSGLVVRGGRLFTVNDSGDGPYLYEVDMRSGETRAVTTFDDEDPEDDEALAPGRAGTVWVGDIGDNRSSRHSIRLYRVAPARSDGTVKAATYDLAYPDRPHNSETLLVHPRTGRVLVVTKSITGGVVYEAPTRLRQGETHELQRVGSVPGLVTDGTFLPGGDRVLLRTYGAAAVYTYPDFTWVRDVPLPVQEQGEAVAVDRGGRVYLSSEGEHSDVLMTNLAPLPEAAGTATPTPTTAPAPETRPEPRQRREYHPEPWLGLGPGPVLLAALGSGALVLLVRAALRRSRRRR